MLIVVVVLELASSNSNSSSSLKHFWRPHFFFFLLRRSMSLLLTLAPLPCSCTLPFSPFLLSLHSSTHTHTHWHTCKQTERVKTSERQLTDRLHGRHILVVVVVAGETAAKEGQIEEEGIEPTAIASANSRQAAAAANRSESS